MTWAAMEEMWIIDLGDPGCGLGPFPRERKCVRASWVVRIGCVRLMDRVAKLLVSVEGGEEGGCQKLEDG